MTAKQPTPQGISALLKRAGFERSESSATRIKGWRNHSEGFTVTGQVLGHIRVEHKTGYDRGPNAQKRRAEMLSQYGEALFAAAMPLSATSYGQPSTSLHQTPPPQPPLIQERRSDHRRPCSLHPSQVAEDRTEGQSRTVDRQREARHGHRRRGMVGGQAHSKRRR